MSKYIIEIKPEYEDSFKGLMILGAKDSNLFVDTLAVENLEELNSDYINEHFGDLQQDAYGKGYKDGRNVTETQAHDDAYQRGLEDAWNIARKIAMETNDGGVSISALYEMFGTESMCMIMKNNTVYDATDKLKAYEEKRKADSEIKVGDEVYAYTPSGKTQPFIIIKIYDEDGVKYYSGINADGNHVQGGLNYIKTGRHFPHVAELLKAMKE